MIISTTRPTRRQRWIGIGVLFLGMLYVGSLFRATAQHEAERSAWFVSTTIARGLCTPDNAGPAQFPAAESSVTFEGDVVECPLTSSPFIWKTSINGVSMTCADLSNPRVFFACSSATTWDGRRIFIFGGGERPKTLRDSQIEWTTQTLK